MIRKSTARGSHFSRGKVDGLVLWVVVLAAAICPLANWAKTELSFALYHVACFSKLTLAPVFLELNRGYADRASGIRARADRLTPTAAAADCAAEAFMSVICTQKTKMTKGINDGSD